ncbi:hypothetical protein [Streptomyces mirabilis]
MNTNRTRYHVGFHEIGLDPEYRVECIGEDFEMIFAWLEGDISGVAEDVEDEAPLDELYDRLAKCETVAELVGEHTVDAFVFFVRPVTDCACPCDCAETGRADECDGEHHREAADPQPAEPDAEGRSTGHTVFVEFFPVVVTDVPTDEDQAPLLVDPAAARIAHAAEVTEGDTVLASFPGPYRETEGGPLKMLRSDYFNDQYEAHPIPYDSTCGCGSCATMADHEGPVVNLGDDNHWEVCDPWPADGLVLIVPA